HTQNTSTTPYHHRAQQLSPPSSLTFFLLPAPSPPARSTFSLHDALPIFPRGVLVIDWLLNVFLVGGLRISYRLLATGRRWPGAGSARRVLLIGAGVHGEALAREMTQRRRADYRPVGFLDDAPTKHGLIIQ